MGLEANGSGKGKWMALTAALLGWLFDGLEMGLFPQVAGPALKDLLGQDDPGQISLWFSVITAGFLVGAATGGVVFGWLGDRIGRVRAMTLSVVTYALFSGLCGLATSAWQVAALRFVAALGMGGEWSLGVALVMEIWPGQSRGLLAGLIGTAANLGYLLVALIGLGLSNLLVQVRGLLLGTGLSESSVEWLVRNDGWRILLLLGTTPALLTFFIRLFVPESSRWEQEQKRGATNHWASRDLLAVLGGAVAASAIIYLWATPTPLAVQVTGTLVGLLLVLAGYLYPTVRYLQRAEGGHIWSPTLRRMLLAACLSGVPLLATWGSVQFAPTWANALAKAEGLNDASRAKYYTQICTASGACLGTLLGALMGDWFGRRMAYMLLCLASMASTLLFFGTSTQFDARFLILAFFAGGLSASFYGWLPLYLPELFRTGVRATGQGFGFNFGRVLAAIGVLQFANLLTQFEGSYPRACMALCLVYVVGVVIIWLAPETRGQGLPE